MRKLGWIIWGISIGFFAVNMYFLSQGNWFNIIGLINLYWAITLPAKIVKL